MGGTISNQNADWPQYYGADELQFKRSCRCGDKDVEMWGCGDVEMWMCGDVDAAKLCLWLVEVLRYKTKKLTVKCIPFYSL